MKNYLIIVNDEYTNPVAIVSAESAEECKPLVIEALKDHFVAEKVTLVEPFAIDALDFQSFNVHQGEEIFTNKLESFSIPSYCKDKESLPPTMSTEILAALLSKWKNRSFSQGYVKPLISGKYKGTFGRSKAADVTGEAELNFFLGATAMYDILSQADITGKSSLHPSVYIAAIRAMSIEYQIEKKD